MVTTVINTIGSGSGRDYPTIQAWKTATDALNLSAAGLDQIRIGELYQDDDKFFEVNAGDLNFNHANLGTNFRGLRPAPADRYKPYSDDGHTGVRIRFTFDSIVAAEAGIAILENKFQFGGGLGLFFRIGQAMPSFIISKGIYVSGDDVYIDGVFLRCLPTGLVDEGDLTAIHIEGSSATKAARTRVYNAIIRGENWQTEGFTRGIHLEVGSEDIAVANCVVHGVKKGLGWGIQAESSEHWIHNVASVGCNASFAGGIISGSAGDRISNCCADDGSLDSTLTTNIKEGAKQIFINATAVDYRIRLDSQAYNGGIDPSTIVSYPTPVPVYDYDWVLRLGSWEIGAYDGGISLPSTVPDVEETTIGRTGDYQHPEMWERATRGNLAFENEVRVGLVEDWGRPYTFQNELGEPENFGLWAHSGDEELAALAAESGPYDVGQVWSLATTSGAVQGANYLLAVSVWPADGVQAFFSVYVKKGTSDTFSLDIRDQTTPADFLVTYTWIDGVPRVTSEVDHSTMCGYVEEVPGTGQTWYRVGMGIRSTAALAGKNRQVIIQVADFPSKNMKVFGAHLYTGVRQNWHQFPEEVALADPPNGTKSEVSDTPPVEGVRVWELATGGGAAVAQLWDAFAGPWGTTKQVGSMFVKEGTSPSFALGFFASGGTSSTAAFDWGVSTDITFPTYSNISYRPPNGVNNGQQKLNIYRSPKNDSLQKVLLCFFMSGFVSSVVPNSIDMSFNPGGGYLRRRFLDAGWTVIDVACTTAITPGAVGGGMFIKPGDANWDIEGNGYDVAFLDAVWAVQWVREYASAYGLDTSTIITYGTSAGGQIALWVATMPDFADAGSSISQCTRSSRVHGCFARRVQSYYEQFTQTVASGGPFVDDEWHRDAGNPAVACHDIQDADATELLESSPCYFVQQGANSSIPIYVSSEGDTGPGTLSPPITPPAVDYSIHGTTFLPNMVGTATGGLCDVHAAWSSITLIQSLRAKFPSQSNRLVSLLSYTHGGVSPDQVYAEASEIFEDAFTWLMTELSLSAATHNVPVLDTADGTVIETRVVPYDNGWFDIQVVSNATSINSRVFQFAHPKVGEPDGFANFDMRVCAPRVQNETSVPDPWVYGWDVDPYERGTPLDIILAVGDKSHYRLLKEAEGSRYDIVEFVGAMIASAEAGGTVVSIKEAYFRLEGIGVDNTSSGSVDGYAVDVYGDEVSVDAIVAKNTIGAGVRKCLRMRRPGKKQRVRNVLAIGSSVSVGAQVGFDIEAYESFLDNCTAYGITGGTGVGVRCDVQGSATAPTTAALTVDSITGFDFVDLTTGTGLVGWAGFVGAVFLGGPFGGQSLGCDQVSYTYLQGSKNSVYVRARLRVSSTTGASTLIVIKNAAGTQIELGHDASGVLTVTRQGGSPQTWTSTAPAMQPFLFYNLEFAVDIHNSTGKFEVRSSGVVVAGLSQSGVDTQGQATTGTTFLTFLHTDIEIDDVIIAVGNGPYTDGDFFVQQPGVADPYVVPIRPFANGDYNTAWTVVSPGVGALWQQVEETFPDLTGSEISCLATGNRVSFPILGLAADAQQIHYVQTYTLGRVPSGTGSINMFMRIGTTDFDHADGGTAMAAGYTTEFVTRKWPVNPATGLPWTTSDISSLNEMGVVRTAASGANALHITTVVMDVLYSKFPPPGSTSALTVKPSLVRNVISVGNDVGFDVSSAQQRNNLSGDGTAAGVGAIRNKTAAQVFYDHNLRDFRLSTTSPALGVGLYLGNEIATDHARLPRASPWDIGAHEGFAFSPDYHQTERGNVLFLCTVWKIEREDGEVMWFTDANAPVPFRGNMAKPAGGFNASARHKEVAFKEQNVEIIGAISSEDIRALDLTAGLYRNAKLSEYLVDWLYPWTAPHKEESYQLLDTEHDREVWKGSVVGFASRLHVEVGDIHTRECAWDLGQVNEDGTGCLVDLEPDTQIDVEVDTVEENYSAFTCVVGTIDASYGDDFFRFGKLIWQIGLNTGLRFRVKSYEASTRTIVIQLKTPYKIKPGDTFTVEPGCNKLRGHPLDDPDQKGDCFWKYHNVVNFNGFEDMPTTDETLATPSQ